jgi:hypothetical protein
MDLIGMDINFGVANIVWEALENPKGLHHLYFSNKKFNLEN